MLGETDIVSLLKMYDIIVLSETMKRPAFNVNFAGYSPYHFPHERHKLYKKRVPGGFIVLIKNNIVKKCSIVKHDTHVVWLHIKSPISRSDDYYIGCVYIPHENSNLRALDYFESLKDDILKFKLRGKVMILGDTNSRTGNLEDFTLLPNHNNIYGDLDDLPNVRARNNCDSIINNYGKELINMCRETGMQIQNGRLGPLGNSFSCYRYNGKSQIDYLITYPSIARTIMSFKICDRNASSDHCPLEVVLPHTRPNIIKKPVVVSKPELDSKYVWDPNLKTDYIKSLHETACTSLYEHFLCNVAEHTKSHQAVIDSFYSFLKASIQPHFNIIKPSKRKPQNKFPINPWFDLECKNLKSDLHCTMKKNPDNTDLINDLQREYKRITQRKKREYQQSIASDLNKLNSDNMQDYWRFWKKFKRKCPDGNHITAQTFTEYYENLKPENPSFDSKFMQKVEKYIGELNLKVDVNIDCPIFDCLNAPIHTEEITFAIKKLKNKKAIGSDGLAAEFYKNSDGHLDKPLSALFNYILNSGNYPVAWSTGIINPIHKKNDITDPENYRKITIQPALGKLFDGVLNNRLTYIKTALKLEDPLQFGFRPKHGSVDNAFILKNIIDINRSNKKPLYVCFIDFKAAFDNINRAALLFKMRQQGITGNFLNIIRDMLNKAKSTVRWNNEYGELFDNLYGVLQGNVSSPALFKLFLEDLRSYLDNIYGVRIGEMLIAYLLLADDLALISETAMGLQKLINGLFLFCTRWHLSVNLIKTGAMIFNDEFMMHLTRPTFYLDNKPINDVAEYKYVGINFTTSRDTFSKHIHDIIQKANRAIFAARSHVRQTMGNELRADLQLKIFDTQIRPIIEYAIPVWFRGRQIQELEKLHTSYIKRVLCVRDQTPHLAIYGDTGRTPLINRQHYTVIKYWCRIINLNEDHILKYIYNSVLQTPNSKSWVNTVKCSLRAAGFSDTHFNEIYTFARSNPRQFLQVAKFQLHENYKLLWLNSIIMVNDYARNPMLHTYTFLNVN